MVRDFPVGRGIARGCSRKSGSSRRNYLFEFGTELKS